MSRQPRRRKPFTKEETPLEPIEAVDSVLPLKETKPTKRDRSWDARRSKTTYDLPAGLIERIREIAAELGQEGAKVRVSDVARLLLEAGMQQYEAGGLDTKPKAIGYKLYDK